MSTSAGVAQYDRRLTRLLVEASLPWGVLCDPENFAGDAGVKDFVDGICRGHPDLDMEVWVHWCGPPDVSVLRHRGQSILVRSERFDVLLIEYYNLLRLVTAPDYTGDAVELIRSAVAKWFTEFLLGLRAPRLALRSFARHRAADQRFFHHTFRDEALASVPEVEKAALQCFSLAHEIAHIVYPRRTGMTLDFLSDGMPLRSHLTWELRQMEMDQDVIGAMLAKMNERMDVDLLVTEIDADVSALGTIAAYLPKAYGVSRKRAFHAALTALQAQSFLNHCKHSCRLLHRHLRQGLDPTEFNMLDWTEGQYVVARTRVALRRAGFLWYLWDKEEGTAGEPDRYREAVDSLVIDLQPFLLTLSQAAFDETKWLYLQADGLRSDQAPEEVLDKDLSYHLGNHDARLEMFYILVAMGYPGGILHNVDALFRNLERQGAET